MTQEIVSHVLETIPFEINLPVLFKRAHVKEGSANARDLQRLAEEALPLARPKGLYLVTYIGERGEDFVDVEGVRFTSRVMRVNMDHAFRVFPYLATCGLELQAWAKEIEAQDMLFGFWAETIKELALSCAIQAVYEHLKATYQPGETSAMNPGSLADWPIQQQVALFSLFGARKDQIGVTLTDSLLMVPTKTVSGIIFPTSLHFESCQLCPRQDCPGRRAEFQPALYQSRYNLP